MASVEWVSGEGLRCRRGAPAWWETIVVLGPALETVLQCLSAAVSRWPRRAGRPWQVWAGCDAYGRVGVGLPRPAAPRIFAALLAAVQREAPARGWEYDFGDQEATAVMRWPTWRPWAVWTGVQLHLFPEWDPAWTVQWGVREDEPRWRWTVGRHRWAVAHAALRAAGLPTTLLHLEQFYWVYFRQLQVPRWAADPQEWPPLPLGVPAEAKAVAERLRTERWGTWRQWAQVFGQSWRRLEREASPWLVGHALVVGETPEHDAPFLVLWPLSSVEQWRSRFHPGWPPATPERFDLLGF